MAATQQKTTADLNERQVKRSSATSFMSVKGDSMDGFGIQDGDTLVVDRSIDPHPGHILVALVDGEVIVKLYEKRQGRPLLYSCKGRRFEFCRSDQKHL